MYISDISAISAIFSRTIIQDKTDDVVVLNQNLTDDSELSKIKPLVNIETTSVSSIKQNVIT
ncbi:MAG TPA: hypothetical protein VFT83_06110 [Nitrososphaeraceae archaeon]|nr:hypothetical protein [Nitrososphaeraceae archaeon]